MENLIWFDLFMLLVDSGSFVLALNRIGSGLSWAQTWLNPTCGHPYLQPSDF